MSMTLAARASHVHHVSARAAVHPRAASPGVHAAPLLWFRRKFRARPGTTLAHCAFAIAAVVILTNALAWQRHDSPRTFIGEQAAVQIASQNRVVPAVAPAAIPLPPVRPAQLDAQPARTMPAVAPRQAVPATPARDQQVGRDPIGDLIRTGQAGTQAGPVDTLRVASATAATPPRPVADSRPVAAAQRALNRVGQGPVKADGVFGEETRAALERFERERRIPVTRDLSPRTLRELTAASGIRME